MYVAVKGGERAIANARAWLDEARRGDPSLPRITPAQIAEQLTLAVDRVMAKGSCCDRDLAAIAQARGDRIEAAFLLRPIAPPCRASAIPARLIPPRCG